MNVGRICELFVNLDDICVHSKRRVPFLAGVQSEMDALDMEKDTNHHPCLVSSVLPGMCLFCRIKFCFEVKVRGCSKNIKPLPGLHAVESWKQAKFFSKNCCVAL